MCRCVKLLTQDTVFGHAPPVPSLPPGSPEGKTSPTKSHHGYRRAVLRQPSGGSLSPTNDLVVATDIWAAVQQRCEGRTVSATHNCAKTRQPPLPCLIPRAWPRSHRRGPLAIGRQPRGPRVHLRCASRHRTLLLLLMSLNRIKRPGLNQQNKLISQCERQAMSRAPTETPVLLEPGVTRSPVAPLLLFPPGYGERSLVLASSSCRP